MAEKTENDKKLLEDIKTEFEYLKNERALFEPSWRDAENHVRANLYPWGTDSKKPKRPTCYTSVPAHYLDTLISGLLGYTISPNITWMKLTLEDKTLLDISGILDWLELVERGMYAEMARSSLYSEAPIFLRDAATFGHGAMLIDEDSGAGRVRYTTLPTPDVYIDINEFGEVDTVYRYYTMTVRNMVSFFGYDAVDPAVQRSYDETARRNAEVHILHAVYPRTERDDTKLDSKNAPFASVYVDLDNDVIIEEKGYRENPYAVFTWSRIPRTAYGNSPSMDAMPDILMLNRCKEASLRVAQRASDPAYNVPNHMRGSESVIPGGFNYYKASTDIITPINVGANFPITLEVTQDIEKCVRDWFHVDFFLMLQASDKQKTATEVVELQGEKAAVLSSLIVNLNSALSAIIRRTFNIMVRQGKIPPPPAMLRQSGTSLNIEFVGPLAQAQKRYHQSGGIMQSLSLAQAVFTLSPQARDFVNGDKLLKNIFETNGFPMDAMREDKEVQQIRVARAEQQAAQQQQAMALAQQQAVLPNIDKMNQSVAPGSMLADVNSQLSQGIVR